MMDNRKRCDGGGALFFAYWGADVALLWKPGGNMAKSASNVHCFGPWWWPKHTSNAVRLRAQAGFSTSHVSSRLVIRLLKRRYHKQIRDAALHFHETKKHVGKFQRAF